MELEAVYNRFFSKVKDKKLIHISSVGYSELMRDYLENGLAIPYVEKIFSSVSLDSDNEEINFELVNPVNAESDERFVIDVLSRAMVLAWMDHNIDTDLSLAIAIGGKEEKMLKNDLKYNMERRETIKKDLQKVIRDRDYYIESAKS